MHPGGYNPRLSTASYGNTDAGGNNAPPYRQPQRQQQMTPQKREEVLMTAGRLAAEYLVSKGELPAHVLHNRPPPVSLPFQERWPAPRPQHHDQTVPFPFQQERPLARQHFPFRPPVPAPRQFQQRTPFAPRPFQGQGRPIAKRPRPSFPVPGRPPASHPAGRFQGRPPLHSGARAPAPSVAAGVTPAGSVTQGDLNDDAATGDGRPVAQSGDADTAQS